MISTNPILGTGFHALGGISAASCYLPNTQTHKWSWGTFWLVQALFAWVLVPILIGWLTVPSFFKILHEAPPGPFWTAFLLGGAYGFGGMSFGKAINHIGYSLTYTMAIGISAVLGTVVSPVFLLRSGTCKNGKFSVCKLGSAYVNAYIFQLYCRCYYERVEER